MTQVDFHFNAPDKWLYISRLLRKANSQGKRVGVWGESPLILKLDQDLWQLGPTDFVSHCMVTEPSHCVERSHVVLSDDWTHLRRLSGLDVYLNLNHSIPSELNQLTRLIEVVGSDDDDKAAARLRWKQYTQLGFQINRFDLAANGTL